MVYVIAHRGFSGKYPENTLLAFKKAVELGVDYIELDVWISLDNRVMVIHDPRLNRTTNGRGRIVLKTFDEIRKYRTVKGNQPVPCLEEVFEIVKNTKTNLNIELKTPWVAKPVADLIKKYDMKDKVIVSSQKPLAIKIFKNEMPDVKAGYLYFTEQSVKFSVFVTFISLIVRPLTEYIMIKTAESLRTEFIHPSYPFATSKFIKKAHNKGYKINVWFVDTPILMKKVIRNKADGIITNRPDLLKKVLSANPKKTRISLKKITKKVHLPKIRLRKKSSAGKNQ